MIDIKSFLSNLTTQPGVYQMLGEDGVVLYVGKAKNLKKRVTSYFSAKQKDIKTQALVRQVKNIDITITRTENEALLLECNLIKKHRPRYNVLLRDDKSYPYILITNEHPYPRIDFYRGTPKKNGHYFGPYPNSAAVRETIHLIQKMFKLRTCQDNFFASRARPCLHHQIGLCSGTCAGLISAEEYAQNVRHAVLFLQGKNQQILEELNKQMTVAAAELNFELAAKFRDQVTQIRQVQERQYVSALHGDVDVIGFASHAGIVCIQLLIIRSGRTLGSRAYFPQVPASSSEIEILTAFIAQHYLGDSLHEIPKEIVSGVKLTDLALLADALSEHAKHKVSISCSVRGEKKKWLEMANASAKQAVSSQLINKSNIKARFVALQDALGFQGLLKRIECFDVSHSMGEATVASCVVFDINGPLKNDYRRFNITDITPGDDVAAMHQALSRRFKKSRDSGDKVPDILLIDGGVPQLHAAESALAELQLSSIMLIGVAKGVTRKPGYETLHFSDQPPVHLPSDSLALHLIQQVRDEAHRFAIVGHRQRRDKKRKTSTLESIEGIGAKRRRELLRYFGGLQALTSASLDEIGKVPGISQSLAQRIFDALHGAA